MEKRFKYTLDRRSRRITWAIGIVVLLIVAYLTYRYFGTGIYFSAWFVSLAVALAALFVLSIPRYIKVTDQAIEIHCIVELTTIGIENIASIRKMDSSEMKLCFPLLGSYGFGGYYGYYYDLSQWEIIHIYASRWADFVEITDIYEERYIVSCDRADELIEAVSNR